jgi:hypothetical protein
MLTSSNRITLTKIFHNILQKNLNLRFLANNIGISKISKYGRTPFSVKYKINLIAHYDGYNYNTVKIHIIPFNRILFSDLLYRIKCDDNQLNYLTTFLNFEDGSNLINIDSKISFTKNIYHYEYYKSYISSNKAHQYYFITDNNYVFAATIHDTLIINESILLLLLSKFDLNIIQDLLEKVLTLYVDKTTKSKQNDISQLKDNVIETVFKKTISRINDLEKATKNENFV